MGLALLFPQWYQAPARFSWIVPRFWPHFRVIHEAEHVDFDVLRATTLTLEIR